jgi:hypothetical protein
MTISPMQYTRELHIDAHQIALHQVESLLRLGFYEDNFTAAGGGIELPAHHFSWETQGANTQTKRERDLLFQLVTQLLTTTSEFKGYIESEVIPPGFQIALPRRPFDDTAKLPLEPLNLIKTTRNKVADLHMKVPLELLNDALESELSRIDCYFVETPKCNRIYTIQFLSHKQGRVMFDLLKHAFTTFGGAVEITYEICDAFVRVPSSQHAPAVVAEELQST